MVVELGSEVYHSGTCALVHGMGLAHVQLMVHEQSVAHEQLSVL
jgi:hypothetical protein